MAILCSAVTVPLAQEEFEDTIYTAGTTYTQPSGSNWAYLVWHATAPGLVLSQPFAVYAKQGNAASPNSYVRKGIVMAQTDPAVIKVLLNRATSVGDNLAQLDQQLRNLFQHLMPSASISLEQKLGLVIQGSLGDADHYENLLLLAGLHPGVALCLGTGYVDPILNTGQTTYEIRRFDLSKNQDIAVVGRVTVTAGAPLVLPAPGAPVAVPETDNKGNPKPNSAKGHLNVKLRWATPPELRRLSMMSYGFNAYRYTKAVAEARNYHNTPPTQGQLRADHANGLAVRINLLPIITDNDFDLTNPANPTANPNDVANFSQTLGGDSTTYFVADDNGANRGGAKFQNGEQFYYFIAACDILGRDGLVSPGAMVTMCDRLPPPAPEDVKIENEYSFNAGTGNSSQRLKVLWRPYAGANETIIGYYVYRWTNASDVQKPAVRVANPPASPLIPHAPGETMLSYIDDGPNAPQMPQHAGLAFWYTVRAVDNGTCVTNQFNPTVTGNESPDSAPAFGVLRDRQGPPAPTGRVSVHCVRPMVEFVTATELLWPEAVPDIAAYQVACTREEPSGSEIVWADFYWSFSARRIVLPPAPPHFIGRVFFPQQYTPGEFVNVPLLIPRADFLFGDIQYDVDMFCRVGTKNGKTSNLELFSSGNPPATNQFLGVLFRGTVRSFMAGNCDNHTPTTPGSNSIIGIVVCADATPEAKEYRIYQRVDEGSPTLINQGKIETPIVCHTNKALPASSGKVCFYVQFLDEHGNASPLTQVGDCTPVTGLGKLPKPLLAPIEVAGTPGSPSMVLSWFCPPVGLDRFIVYIGQQFGEPPDQITPDLSANLFATNSPPTTVEPVALDGVKTNQTVKAYYTMPVGPAFGDGASFEVEVPIVKAKRYTVFVRAVDKAGNLSEASNGEQFKWSVYKKMVPQVPWPARDLPEPAGFDSNIVAMAMPPAVYKGLGVRIGEMPCVRAGQGGLFDTCVPAPQNPARYVYHNSKGEYLIPIVLYRVQVTNGFFQAVSHDVIQVSPMIDQIAYQIETIFDPDSGQGYSRAQIYDPFIKPFATTADMAVRKIGLYLVDTQPVVRGARYRYLLVRFHPKTREIEQVMPTNEVDVP